MKIFLVDTQNKRTVVEINKNDYIGDIKKNLLYQNFGNNIELRYNGEILDDNEKVFSYDIEERDVIVYLSQHKSHDSKIIIIDSEGYNEKFNDQCGLRVLDIKEKLRKKYGIKSEIKFYYKGIVLDDYDSFCELDDKEIIIFFNGKFKG